MSLLEYGPGLTASDVCLAAARAVYPVIRNRKDLLAELAVAGRHERAGHDRRRWETVQWDDYATPLPAGLTCGSWAAVAAGTGRCWPGRLIAEAEHMPWHEGRYVQLAVAADHDQFLQNGGPVATAGRLVFCDAVTAMRQRGQRILCTGLGLGIVPSWLLRHASPSRVDVAEVDAGVIGLHRGQAWTADNRLHIYRGDAYTWTPGRGCELHGDCQPADGWDCGFHDIWTALLPSSVPLMKTIEARYASRCGWQMSHERIEAEARLRRAQDLTELTEAVAGLSRAALIVMKGTFYPDDPVDAIARAEWARRRYGWS